MMQSPENANHADSVVYIIDDDQSLREAIEDLLHSVGLQAVSFASVQQFLDAGQQDAPSCLVLDIRMPGMSGLDFHREMNKWDVHLPVIFITGHGDIPMSVRAMKQGAVEFLTKPFREQDLLDAIHQALALDRENRAVRNNYQILRTRYASLNDGERDVVQQVVAGLLNKQIAAELGVSEITVKVRRAQAMRKMQATSLPELVRMIGQLQAVKRPV
ncbi:response regulator transcription factor [Pseudochrobactrum sp. HB0163]|uniref:response regulator transcription factor n=1 Tax=Pseudochrobactrum sp. HB0163 TaxID=3450708 RepID=UPI003F6DAB2D